MTELSPNLNWQWLPLGYRALAAGSVAISSDKFDSLLELIANQILPPDVYSAQTLVDVGPGEDKTILEVNGQIRTSSEEDEDEEWIPFVFALKAEFKEFHGSHKIVYSLAWEKSEEVEKLSLREIGAREDIKLLEIKLRLAYFESRFTSIFGYSPVATRNISLHANDDSLQWSISVEGKKTRELAKQSFHELAGPFSAFLTEYRSKLN